jgi:exodeoxyribonuclease-1
MSSFLFYDLETSGLNKAFDQILQFAAIRTDPELQEKERHRIDIRLRPDIIVSPRATITHRLSPEDIATGVGELEALVQIHQWFNRPGTVSLGYNTLGFDDEFIRFSFYRNLLPPYTHQYGNGCRRMDLLPMTVLYHLYKPEVLEWPQRKGRTVLKLEDISRANGLSVQSAHDAMADTEATLALAHRLRSERDMWEYLNGYFFKQTDAERIEKLPVAIKTHWGDHRFGIMTGSEFGPDLAYQVPVLSIGRSLPYSNQTLWLRIDDTAIMTSDNGGVENTRVMRKRLGEPAIILPPLDRFSMHIGKKRLVLARQVMKWLEKHPSVFDGIIRYHQEFAYPEVPDVDADAALYQDGFMSRKDQELCRRFHRSAPEEKEKIARQFSKPALRDLGVRILARNFSEHLSEAGRKGWCRYLEKIAPREGDNVPLDYRGQERLTPAAALQEIEELKNSGEMDEEQMKLLDASADDLQRRFPHRQ